MWHLRLALGPGPEQAWCLKPDPEQVWHMEPDPGRHGIGVGRNMDCGDDDVFENWGWRVINLRRMLHFFWASPGAGASLSQLCRPLKGQKKLWIADCFLPSQPAMGALELCPLMDFLSEGHPAGLQRELNVVGHPIGLCKKHVIAGCLVGLLGSCCIHCMVGYSVRKGAGLRLDASAGDILFTVQKQTHATEHAHSPFIVFLM